MFVVTVLLDYNKKLVNIILWYLWKVWCLDKASAISDVVEPGCSKVDSAETSVCMDGTRTINNNKLKEVKSKINIIAKKKQTNANNNNYYVLKWEQNLNNTR